MLARANDFDSVEDFIKDDIELLASDDEEQADEIRQLVRLGIK